MSTGDTSSASAIIDSRELRRVMGTFATGIAVITMPAAGGAWGMTANSLTSLSLNPPLVLVAVDKSTRTHEHLEQAASWAINILSAEQEPVSRTFAMKDYETERTMVNTPYRTGKGGAPIIAGSLAYLECTTWATYDGGDHTIFVGEVKDLGVLQDEGAPILYFRGRYVRLAPPEK